MLKKILPLVLISVVLAGIGTYFYVNKTQSYKYSDSQTHKEKITRVEFSNGASISIMKPDDWVGGGIVATSFDGKQTKIITDEYNDRVLINDYFPSQRSADMAIISETTSGTISQIIGWSTKVVVPEGNFVKVYDLGGEPKDFTATFNRKRELLTASAEMTGRTDDLGSPITYKVDLVRDVGFVEPEMKQKYYKLVGKHPEVLFEDPETRELLLKTVSKEEFRALRVDISRAPKSELLRGRYILFEGCNPAFCGGGHAAILIDTYTDNLWWTKISDNENNSGGTMAASKDTNPSIETLKAVVHGLEDNMGHTLAFSQDGELIYKRK